MAAAKVLGLTIPQALLATADELIAMSDLNPKCAHQSGRPPRAVI
jgi:hypothetical protein